MITKGVPQNSGGIIISDSSPMKKKIQEEPKRYADQQIQIAKNPETERELERLGRMILQNSVLRLPSGATFTYTHDWKFTPEDIDFIISYFELRKKHPHPHMKEEHQ